MHAIMSITNYIKCYIKDNVDIDSFVEVKIEEPYKDGAIAKLIKR